MSLRNADSHPSTSARRVWSITQRFTLLYVVSTFSLLLLAVGFLYGVLKRSLDARDHALVVSKAQVLTLLLREQPVRIDVLANEVEHEAASGPLHYFLRVLDSEGAILVETPGMGVPLPVELFPEPVRDLSEPLEVVDSPGFLHHEAYLMLAVDAVAEAASAQHHRLHVALDISTDLDLIADYRRKLFTVLGLAFGLSALVGAWLARKGAQPIVAMTRRARHVSASHLNERITVSQWPSELAELAAAFNAMLDRLEESFTRLSQFSGDLAHELRTPINNLRGEAEVALARSRTPAEYQEILGSSLEELDRLSRMIEGLLFIARAENPQAVLTRIRFDVRKEADAVIEFHQALAEEVGVRVKVEGDASLSGDALLFRRALSNLLANALRHTSSKGLVMIRLRTLHEDAVEVSVSDSGEGIPEDHLARVFDRFHRVGDTTSGAGLGLAIVQSIMHLHGGSATVRSRPGKGATFTLHFPVRP